MTVTIKIPRDFLIVKFGGAAQGTAAGKYEGQAAQSTLRGSVQGLLRLNILHRRWGGLRLKDRAARGIVSGRGPLARRDSGRDRSEAP